MGPVCGAKGIIDINIAKLSQFGCKIRIILCFFLVISQVLQQKDISLVEGLNGIFNGFSDAVINKFHFPTQQRVENRDAGFQR